MTRMIGTGEAPHGYTEGQMFDVPDEDHGTVEDLVRRGWADIVDPKDDPGRSKVSIADAMIRNDLLSNPDDAAVAAGISDPHAIVHTVNPDATQSDYDAEVASLAGRNAVGTRVEEAAPAPKKSKK